MADSKIVDRAARIELAVFDVDGVMTDGSIMLGSDGHEYKAFNVRDGHGLVMLGKMGVERAVITGRVSPAVNTRMKELAIKHVYQGVQDKLAMLKSILDTEGISAENVCYVGDDEPDIVVMNAVGFPVAVADAEKRVREAAIWVTTRPGGNGAVRDVCDLIQYAYAQLNRKPARGKAAPEATFQE